ncbi:MAG: GNAT family N-acetyltransferase [Hyphomicrobiales bacterium]
MDPNWRFKGVSSALLSAMEELASTAGCLETRLESTKTAERFYRARGYRTSRHGPGDGLWLAKTLS